ncbi:hypothetical protein D5I55_13640 [Chakrabartia godavariana]|nr:hypothetical protein D5I55_13640 [Chakrabartia godavariana]
MEEWQLLLPMVGFTDEHNVRFSGEETAVFYAAGETDFLMDLLLLAQRNAATTTSFIHYCQQRAALVDILPKPTRFVGERGEAMLTEQQVLETLPHTIPVNMIAREIAANLEEDLSLCRKVASQFGPIVQAYFNDDKFVSLGFPDDDKLEEFIRSPTP